jgi:hypothetical protein
MNMCRSIKTLRGVEPAVTEEEIQAAALQFVRKLSGYRNPSAANRAVFETAVDEIAAASSRLLSGLTVKNTTSRTLASPRRATHVHLSESA